MRRILAIGAVVLALGYLIPLSRLPSGDPGTQAFEQHAWMVAFVLLCASAIGSFFLFRLKGDRWIAFALVFSSLQVFVWWWFSGVQSVDGGLLLLLEKKMHATAMLLRHEDFRVVLATFHQEIAVGLFYHLALVWLLIDIGRKRLALGGQG